MQTRNHINLNKIIISIYILLFLEVLFRVYRSNQSNTSLHIEIILAAIVLIIQIVISQVISRKEATKVQYELSTLSKRIPCGVAKVIIDNNLTLQYANEAFHHIFGYDSSELNQIMENKTALLIHPADLDVTISDITTQAAYHTDISIDYRIIHKTGDIRWIHLDAYFSENLSNTPIYQCIFTDITDFQISLQQTQMEKERYRIITELSDDILFEYDIRTGLLTASQAFIKEYGMNPSIHNFRENVLDNHLVHHLDYDIFTKLCDSMDAGEEKISYELRFRLSADRFVWYHIQGTALTDKRGEPMKIIGKAVNIDLLKKEKETLTKKTQLDPLTGVYNKVVTGQLIDEYLDKQKSGDNSLSALYIIDIDNFKGINDNLGHLFGDSVLTEISDKVKSILRNSDIVGRIGGDEFVVFLKDIKRRDLAIHKAKEICDIFRSAYTGENMDYKISGSIGVTLFPEDGTTYEELFRNADQSLYVAKNGGKDRFEFYSGIESNHHEFSRSGVISDYRDNVKTPVRIQFDDLPMEEMTKLFHNNAETTDLLKTYHLMYLQTEKRLKELSSIDTLTGVRSFEAFHTEAEELIKSNSKLNYALITCDIEHFKDINSVIGHDNGDALIIYLAKTIKDSLSSKELIGRVSADIFTILHRYESKELLEDTIKTWCEQFVNHTKKLNYNNDVFLSTGVYLLLEGEYNIPSMIDKANAARKLIKGCRNHSLRYYDNILHQKILHEKELEMSMISSLKNDDYIIFLQPKFRLSDHKIVGAEALVRWNHPTKGFIQPSEFIPLFERNRFIIDLDFHVFEKVCSLLHKWITANNPVIPVSVNFSRVHLAMPDFIHKIIEISTRYDITPDLLEIELTESAFIDKYINIQTITQELKQHGFTVSMDDFGSGYSSLNALKDLPIDVIKLDKDFFRNDITSAKDKIIVEGFIKMAKQMNLRVISEGIETEEQANFLRDIACDMAQGYFFAKPIPIGEFEEMLVNHTV